VFAVTQRVKDYFAEGCRRLDGIYSGDELNLSGQISVSIRSRSDEQGILP